MTTLTDKQFYCTRCCRIVPIDQVVSDSDAGEKFHDLTGELDSAGRETHCGGTLVDASPAESSPAKFEALLVDQARESQASPLDSAPHLARQHIQWLESMVQVVEFLLSDWDKYTGRDNRELVIEAGIKEIRGCLSRRTSLTDHQCPSCSVSLIPSGLADASLLCPLCSKRFAQPSEPSIIPSPSHQE